MLRRCAAARHLAERCDGHVPQVLRSELDAAAEQLRGATGSSAALALLQVVDDERELLRRVAQERRRAGLLRIREAIARLRALPSRAAIIEAAPRAACHSCGLARTLLSRIDGTLWVPEILSTSGPESEPDDFRAYLRMAEIPLEHMLLETDMVRRARPALVADARGDSRTHKAIINASGAHSYTASPLVPARRAIGFLHGDRLGQEQPVTEEDRDNLWTFAEQLSLVLEGAALRERLAQLEADARRTTQAALDDLAQLRTAPLSVSDEPPGLSEPPDQETVPTARLLLALTERERQVLDLMATGATNLEIAHELVVSESTVKSHVTHILRKLRVENRAQAVVRHLHTAPRSAP